MLSIDHLCLSTDDSDLITDLTLQLPPGECLAVVGPNGSGKSTLLRAIAGLRRPDSGEIRVGGIIADDSDPAFRAAVSVELGDDATFAELTVLEHLRLITAAHDVDTEIAAVALDGSGIGDLADRFPHTLSTGQRQRFSMCAAWIRPADLVVIDEPEAGLDVAGRDWVAQRIRRSTADARSVVFATHSPELVSRGADQTVTVGR
ncbi:ABC transporter ATP-binding protein [Williamsia phyllosphaerae]|uniref:ABC transporter ATP-binding protein n=1 Tax=Williamsia phyllosphaerae TaxID=885042 RepID=A0ABQ1URA7_9NOCA|nr:ABC transporter ATP-binding protein [Williamsia phyllosphaerae]GGF24015.1 ABC transporter ATP-binding protein [Williamsia phyllosphaerae]